jgi:hypothetical protein
MIAALAGVITGTAGLVLGILNYLRDRPKVIVALTWDMKMIGAVTEPFDPGKLWGVLSVTNVGRRPIFVSHASLHVPGQTKYYLLKESVEGVKLLESDAPKLYLIDQQSLVEWAAQWHKLRGCVIDQTGRHWHSAPMKEAPPWAKSAG